MVLNKRVVKGAESHVDFGYVASMSDKADLHQAVRHQTMAGILGQLSTLLSYANELYADLHRELSNDAQRISALAARTQAAYDYLPHLETYIHNTGPEEFINRGGSEYKQKGGEDCQLLSPGTRATATVVVYDTECVPPPDLSPLDPYREDGRPCIKDYTNPAFFVEEWIAEQKRQAQEARRRREKSRKTKQDERGVLRRANEAVEVKKLKKTRYNQWGEKIQDGDDDGAVAAPSREATKSAPRVEATAAPKELTESSKGHKKREKKTLFKGKEKEKEQRESERKGSTVSRPPPPAGAPSPRSSAPAAAPPPAAPSFSAPAPPAAPFAPPPAPGAPPPPAAPSAPAPPAAPSFSAPAPPPPAAPGAPAPPPPAAPGAPPPPPGGPAAPEEKRSNLLLQIQAGMQLKKAEQVQKPAPVQEDGSINIGAILARRMAMEGSDDEDDDDSDGGEWDDGGDNDWDD